MKSWKLWLLVLGCSAFSGCTGCVVGFGGGRMYVDQYAYWRGVEAGQYDGLTNAVVAKQFVYDGDRYTIHKDVKE